jgi:hypothetical protein
MAQRYSPLTVVVLRGAFALLGYLGARVSEQQASRDNVGSPPRAVHPADEKTSVAPSERTGAMLAAKPPADTATIAAPADTSGCGSATGARRERKRKHHRRSGGTRSGSPNAPRRAARGQLDTGFETSLGRQRGRNAKQPWDMGRPHERQPRLAERVAAARQPVLSEGGTGGEKPRAKHTRTHQSRHREVAERNGLPGRSQPRRYAARGDMPTPPTQGLRLFPFLPFLPF